jgi:prepilin-type processing-associated H-X9-DG protein
MALAINMYLADNNDTFPPSEHRQEVLDFFTTKPGGGGMGSNVPCDLDPEGLAGWAATIANPYLPWPVVLDEYVKNRDVWRCPSAILENTAGFIIGGGGDWMGYLQSNEGAWGSSTEWGGQGVLGPVCFEACFPSGWGGDITDSIIQQQGAGTGDQSPWVSGPRGGFVMSIGTMKENLQDVKLASISDPVHLPVAADCPPPTTWLTIPRIAYANVCCAECAGVQWGAGCGNGEGPSGVCWGDDAAGMNCFNTIHVHRDWARDPDRKRASARHLGGTNIGFADGHAAWWSAQALLAASDEGTFERIGFNCEASGGAGGSSPEDYAKICGGTPPSDLSFLHSNSINYYGKPN